MRCVTACDAYDDPSTFADGASSPGPQALETLEGFRHPVTSCVEADQNRVGGCYPRSQKCGNGLSERQPGRAPSTPAMREDVRGVRTKHWSEDGSVSRLASRMCLLADFVRFVLDWGPLACSSVAQADGELQTSEPVRPVKRSKRKDLVERLSHPQLTTHGTESLRARYAPIKQRARCD